MTGKRAGLFHNVNLFYFLSSGNKLKLLVTEIPKISLQEFIAYVYLPVKKIKKQHNFMCLQMSALSAIFDLICHTVFQSLKTSN